MSEETMEWLNSNILVGFTDERGNAWHYRQDLQGSEPNHYNGAVPTEDILRRLFSWKAISAPVFIRIPATFDDMTGVDDNGSPIKFIQAENRQAILRDDTNALFEIFTDGYRSHQYGEWLVQNLANIIDDEINFGSAGLLKNGAIAFVSLEMPESVEVIEGFSVRPHLLATTSHNGRLPTTYKSVSTFVVCDNTHAMAMNEDSTKFKTRHSKNSQLRIQTARDALGIVHKMTDDIVAEVLALSSHKVTNAEWEKVLMNLAPIPELKNNNSNRAAVTRAENKRDALVGLYNFDARVAPWKDSALGVLQAFNTYNHHIVGSSGDRAERNMMNALIGKTDTADRKVLDLLGVISVIK
jgi:phage/plasmid-like protein (TIGR03299 family)